MSKETMLTGQTQALKELEESYFKKLHEAQEALQEYEKCAKRANYAREVLKELLLNDPVSSETDGDTTYYIGVRVRLSARIKQYVRFTKNQPKAVVKKVQSMLGDNAELVVIEKVATSLSKSVELWSKALEDMDFKDQEEFEKATGIGIAEVSIVEVALPEGTREYGAQSLIGSRHMENLLESNTESMKVPSVGSEGGIE